MDLSRDSLNRPAREMAHRLARDLTKQVANARKRLGRRGDPEALHDFRVARRRLRTILRAYMRERLATPTQPPPGRTARMSDPSGRIQRRFSPGGAL